MGKKLLLLGGGGHCRSVLDSIRRLEIYSEIAIVAPDNEMIDGVQVIGNDDDLPQLFQMGWKEAFITVGSIGNPIKRCQLYEKICALGMRSPLIIDPSAIVADNAKIADGTYIGKKVIVNAGVTIGSCAIINTGSIVEHDCEIGDFAHLSPGGVLCGGVRIGKATHIGAGAVVKQGLHIGTDTVVGMGSVVLADIPENVIAYGNPCKVQRRVV